MTKWFSIGFYKDTLRRIRGFTIAMLIVTAGFAALGGFGHLFSYVSSLISSGSQAIYTSPITLFDVNSFARTFSCVIAPLMTVRAFEFMMKRNEADFFGTLPVTRSAMTVSAYLAAVSSATFILLASSLVSILVIIPCLGKTAYLIVGRSLLQLLGAFLSILLSCAAATLACSVTGITSNAVFVSAAILFVPRILLGIVDSAVSSLVQGSVAGHVIPLFNNNYNIVTAFIVGKQNTVLSNPWAYVYTLLLAAGFFTIALLAHGKRRSETATHPFSCLLVRHAVAVSVALIPLCGAISVFCIESELVILSVFLVALSIGGFFVMEVVYGRKENNFASMFIALPVLIALGIASAIFVGVSGRVMDSYRPEAEEIEYVSVIQEEQDSFGYYNFDQYVTLKSGDIRLTDGRVAEIVSDAFDRFDSLQQSDEVWQTLTFRIKAKGGVKYRSLYVTAEEAAYVFSKLGEVNEYRELWMNVAEGAMNANVYVNGFTLEGEAASSILSALRDEIDAVGFDKWFYEYTYGDSPTVLHYNTVHNGKAVTVTLPIPSGMIATSAVLEEQRVKESERVLALIKDAVKKAEAEKDPEIFISSELITNDKEFYYLWFDYSTDKEKGSEFANELLPLLTTGPIDPEGLSVTFDVSSSSLFSDAYYYGEFAVRSDVTEQQLVELFKKYEYTE